MCVCVCDSWCWLTCHCKCNKYEILNMDKSYFCEPVSHWRSLLLPSSLHCRFYFRGFEWIDHPPSLYPRTHIHTFTHWFSLSALCSTSLPFFLPQPPPSLLPLGCGFDWIYAVHAAWSWWSWQLWFLSQWISFASQQPPPRCSPQPCASPSL